MSTSRNMSTLERERHLAAVDGLERREGRDEELAHRGRSPPAPQRIPLRVIPFN